MVPEVPLYMELVIRVPGRSGYVGCLRERCRRAEQGDLVLIEMLQSLMDGFLTGAGAPRRTRSSAKGRVCLGNGRR